MPDTRARLESYQPLWTNWYIDSYISRGASSEVYLCRQHGFDITCAVKVISVELHNEKGMSREQKLHSVEEKRSRAEREIGIMYQLNDCPYIVHCKNHDIRDMHDETGALVGFDILIQMNYYTCLEKHIAENDVTLSSDEVIKLALNIGTALKEAHDLSIIHRDIKPENIFLDKHGNYLLGDFGVSKQMQTNNYSTIAGTQPYIAPEIYRAGVTGRYNHTADIYSLGLVLYTLLNNNYYPFVTENSNLNDIDSAISDRLAGKQLPPPANGSALLKAIVLKCCQFAPADRYQSVDDLLKALERISAMRTNDTSRQHITKTPTHIPHLKPQQAPQSKPQPITKPKSEQASQPKPQQASSEPPIQIPQQSGAFETSEWAEYLNAHIKQPYTEKRCTTENNIHDPAPSDEIDHDAETMLLFSHHNDQTVYADLNSQAAPPVEQTRAPYAAPVRDYRSEIHNNDKNNDHIRSNTPLVVMIIVIAALLVAASIFVLGGFSDRSGKHETSETTESSQHYDSESTENAELTVITMPELVGHSIDEMIERYGDILTFNVTYAMHNNCPEGMIFYQDIAVDARVGKGTTVNVRVSGTEDPAPSQSQVSDNEANIIMPDFTMRRYTDVSNRYNDTFSFVPTYEYSDDIAAGAIISQDIPADSLVQNGTIINVTVSLGPKP